MVYNFILDSSHIMIINNVECCTLGHNFTDNDVIKHDYFGTNKVINDINELPETNGVVVMDSNYFLRDDKSRLIVGLIKPE